jgi:hypothetical protein
MRNAMLSNYLIIITYLFGIIYAIIKLSFKLEKYL